MDWKLLSAVVVVAAVVTLTMVGCGHRAFGPTADTPQARAEWMVKRVADRLDLTPSQQEELDRMVREMASRHEEIRAEHGQARQRLLAMVRSDAIDRAELDRLVDEKKAAVEAMIPFFLDRAVAFHALLTPEQRETLASEMEKHHDRRRRCWQRWSACK